MACVSKSDWEIVSVSDPAFSKEQIINRKKTEKLIFFLHEIPPIGSFH